MYRLVNMLTGEEYKKTFRKIAIAKKYLRGLGHTGFVMSNNHYLPLYYIQGKEDSDCYVIWFPSFVGQQARAIVEHHDINVCA